MIDADYGRMRTDSGAPAISGPVSSESLWKRGPINCDGRETGLVWERFRGGEVYNEPAGGAASSNLRDGAITREIRTTAR